MVYSRIIATGQYLPTCIKTNHDLALEIETSDEWIQTRTGIKQRHVADPTEKTSDLALKACQAALAEAGLQPNDIDLIIVATSTPDQVFPSTAAILQYKLGVTNGCPVFDVQAVCSGFVYALNTADLYIKTGQVKRALIVGAEIFTRILDWQDRSTCVLFGDGAGAVILEASETPGILSGHLHADGRYHDILSVPGWVADGAITGRPLLTMEGSAVFKFAVKALADVAFETLEKANLTVSDIDWYIAHQANVRILQATAKRIGIDPEKVVMTVAEHANTSAASVPLALDVARKDGRVQKDDILLLEGVGGGFTWGALLVQM